MGVPHCAAWPDVRLDPQGARAVLALRGKLGEAPRMLSSPEKYVDDRYWRKAMAG